MSVVYFVDRHSIRFTVVPVSEIRVVEYERLTAADYVLVAVLANCERPIHVAIPCSPPELLERMIDDLTNMSVDLDVTWSRPRDGAWTRTEGRPAPAGAWAAPVDS